MPDNSHRDSIESVHVQFDRDTVEAFMPFFSVAERERIVRRGWNGSREWPYCHPVSCTSAAPGAHIGPGGERHHLDPKVSAEADEKEGFGRLGNEIISRLVEGPVPLPFLVTTARRCGFPGLPLIESAASVSCSMGSGASPFNNAERTAEAGLTIETAFQRLFSVLGEERPGQLEMAKAVENAFRSDGIALIEAGTGTGKSLGYLVPSVLYSLETGERILISTHTRNLQDQLFNGEMPVLRGILDTDISVERLAGRENYICSKRLVSIFVRDMEEKPERALALGLGAALSGEGTVDSLPDLPDGIYPQYLKAPPRCLMNACGQADHCPLVRIRRRAREAEILFVNHALLMTDYRQGGTVLGAYRRVVFDEAHHLERCVMENLSISAARDDIERILETAGPFSRNNEKWKFLVNDLEGSDPSLNYWKLLEGISAASKGLRDAYAGIFESIENKINDDKKLSNTKTRYLDGEAAFADVQECFKSFWLLNKGLRDLLKPILEARVSPGIQDFQQELIFMSEELKTLSDGLQFLATARDEDFVFWLEWGAAGGLERICASPLCVDRLFADYMEEICESAVFTSATIAQGDSFSYTARSLGLHLLGKVPSELMAPSPFSYERSCLILLHAGLGDPNSREYADDVGEVVSRLASDVERRMMVLFTSYRLCHATARFLRGSALRQPVLVQGEGESREALSERLRSSGSGILLGVASFWEGVDFPGEELELLVIPKLPFPVPTEPIVEARSQRLRALGEDPFVEIFLPKAILRLRQGIGRLIRRKMDRGVVVILDERLETRPYGEIILSSLPARAVRTETIDGITAESLKWFGTP